MRRFSLLLAILALLPVAARAQVAPPTAVIAPATDDAAAYAERFAVPVDTARQRLAALEALVAPVAALRRTYRERLAGIAIVHQPALAIRVLLTGDVPVAETAIAAGGLAIPVTFQTGATATLEELRTALANAQAPMRAALGSPPGIGIDQRTGELVVIIAKADLEPEGRDALTQRLHDIAGVPLRLRSVDVPGVDLADPALAEGGARLVGTVAADHKRYMCTAGFVVTDGARTGIATAAHCPDDIGFIDAEHHETPLAFVGQWGWGYQDVQINASETPLPPLFFADTAKTASRAVTGQRARDDAMAGDFVCHRGERTGYSCATVELTDFAPAGDLCGGACTPSWTTVAGPHCGGGDSGAPVFIGSTALGIVKGGSYRGDGSCAFYFYMSTDYLPTGWRLLTTAVSRSSPLDPTAVSVRAEPVEAPAQDERPEESYRGR